MDDLKSYRENEIKWYILTFLLITIGVYGTDFLQNTIPSEDTFNYSDLLITAAFSGAICTLAFVMDSLFTSKFKETLVFFRKKRVPGASIFSRIKNCQLKDNRFSTAEASVRYQVIIENIPVSNKEHYENAQWYKIYYKYKGEGAVVSTHRDFLLCRDLCITTIIIALLTGLSFSLQLISFNKILLGYLLSMLIITNIATRNKAHRFVNTVIAADIANGLKNKDDE